MSDARWIEIERDVQASVTHFAGAVRAFTDPDLRTAGWEGYKTRMSLMHAMQAGHTSLETALLRILVLRGEDRPGGEFRHADMVRRCATATDKRPAVLSAALVRAVDRSRRFRHVAVRTYDFFDPDEADNAIDAAGQIASLAPAAIAQFRATIDRGGDRGNPVG